MIYGILCNDQIKHPIDSVFELIDAELALNKMNKINISEKLY